MGKLDAGTLPEEEQKIYQIMSGLKKGDKAVLWKLIRESSKDHISLYPEVNGEIRRLEALGLITLNYHYEGNDYSFFVLRSAPHLMKKLRNMSFSQSGLKKSWWRPAALK